MANVVTSPACASNHHVNLTPLNIAVDALIQGYLDAASDALCWSHWYASHGQTISGGMERLHADVCIANAIGWASR